MWRYTRALGIAVAAGLAMSSAPLLSLGMQTIMFTWDRWTRGFALRTHVTIAILVGLYLGVLMVATRPPVQILISIATFDPWTGYYRMMIWDYGLDNLWGSPWFGIGLNDWQRPDWMFSPTIDAYWLVLPLRAGIPAILLLMTGIILVARRVIQRGTRAKDPLRRRMSTGWMISLLAFCILGATVHFWNVPHALLYFYLGLGSALADPRRVASAVKTTAASAMRPIRRRHPSFAPIDRPAPLPPPMPMPA